MRKKRVAVFISGGGSNLQALIDAAMASDYPAQIVLVVSNNAEAGGLERAERAEIATLVVNHKDYESRTEFEAVIEQALEDEGAELICLAGFMRVLSEHFVRVWENKIINIHPSLLPKYRGLNTHERALEAGDKQAGCTVHWVVPDLDAGPIIAQKTVPVHPQDTVETLAARVLVQEHLLYPKVLHDVALGLV